MLGHLLKIPNVVCAAHDSNNETYRVDLSDGTSRLATAEEIAVAQLAVERAAIKPINATQIRIALNQTGLRSMVEAAISGGSQDLKDWWEFSTNLYRDHPLVVQMIAELGLPPEQVDDLWRLAATIE